MNADSIGGLVELIAISVWRCFLQLFPRGPFGFPFESRRIGRLSLIRFKKKYAVSLWIFCGNGVYSLPDKRMQLGIMLPKSRHRPRGKLRDDSTSNCPIFLIVFPILSTTSMTRTGCEKFYGGRDRSQTNIPSP